MPGRARRVSPGPSVAAGTGCSGCAPCCFIRRTTHFGVFCRHIKLQWLAICADPLGLFLTEFILPPPHPSVKERDPGGGVVSYDQIKHSTHPPPRGGLGTLGHGNGVTLRTQKVIQGGDNGHVRVGRPCEVSPAPPCPELFCELRGLCRHSNPGPRTCGRSEKPISSGGGVSIRVFKETFLPLNVQPVFSF
jgi:hypothetical protein